LNGKKELDHSHNPINFTIPENYYRDLRNEKDLSNIQILKTVKEAKKIMKTAQFVRQKLQRDSSFMNNMGTDGNRIVLPSENNSHLIMVRPLEKNLTDCDGNTIHLIEVKTSTSQSRWL
jgi:hypothetical protein